MRQLRSSKFFDDVSVRFISIEWYTYNAAVGVFSSAKYFHEVTSAGGWVPSAYIRSFRVFTGYKDNRGWVAFDIIFTLFWFYYVVKLVVEWRRFMAKENQSFAYWIQPWVVLEWVNLTLMGVSFGLHYQWYRGCNAYTESLKTDNPDLHPERLNYIMSLAWSELYLNGINTVLCFLKILKFVQMNAKLSILTRTMSRALNSIVGLLIVFFLIMLAFALSGVQLYGNNLFEWRDTSSAFSTLFRALMGEFTYDEMRVKNRGITFIYFWSFIILALFVMLNFITAIIGTAYEEEQSAEKALPLALLLRRAARMMRTFNARDAFKSTWNFLVARTRRLRGSVLLEYLAQHRSSLLACDGIDEAEIRKGDALEPEYTMNRASMGRIIPKRDRNFLTDDYVDEVYLEICEDYDTVHRDEEAEEEAAIGIAFRNAIGRGFQKTLHGRTDEVLRGQDQLRFGSSTKKAAEEDDDVGMFNSSDIAMAILQKDKEAAGDAPGAINVERRTAVLATYLEHNVGKCEPRAGLHGVYESATELEYAMRQVNRLLTARAHTLGKEFEKRK